MPKIKVISYSNNSLIAKQIKSEGMESVSAYKGGIMVCFRYVFEQIGYKSTFFFNKKLKNYNGTIIVADAMISYEFLEWLKSENANARIIFWYWNNLTDKMLQPEKIKALGIETWSYNKFDCEKYNLQYNTQFYSVKFYEKMRKPIKQSHIDLAFIGKDKGRMSQIDGLKKKTCLKVYTYYVADHFYLFFKNFRYHFFPISYKKMIEIQNFAKAILDIETNIYGGLSLRIFDGLYFEKKVVTNNRSVIDEEFYDADNFFILGYDDIANIGQFLNTDYKKINSTIIQKYEFQNWLARFLNM